MPGKGVGVIVAGSDRKREQDREGWEHGIVKSHAAGMHVCNPEDEFCVLSAVNSSHWTHMSFEGKGSSAANRLNHQ